MDRYVPWDGDPYAIGTDSQEEKMWSDTIPKVTHKKWAEISVVVSVVLTLGVLVWGLLSGLNHVTANPCEKNGYKGWYGTNETYSGSTMGWTCTDNGRDVYFVGDVDAP